MFKQLYCTNQATTQVGSVHDEKKAGDAKSRITGSLIHGFIPGFRSLLQKNQSGLTNLHIISYQMNS
jgi:hypothetical protein